MLGFGKLTKAQLETALCEVEATINHRPLTFVTEDPNDLIPLTPAMFFHSFPGGEVPESKLLTVEALHGKKKRLDQLMTELQQRFRKEYLGLLVQRGSSPKCRQFNVGECVLLGSENRKRILWPMGRILELIPGKDGVCRVARVKIKTGELVRPLQRLYPLEFSQRDSDISTNSRTVPAEPEEVEIGAEETIPLLDEAGVRVPIEDPVQRTRSGRLVRKPKVWDL